MEHVSKAYSGGLAFAPLPHVYDVDNISSSATLDFSHSTDHEDGTHSLTQLNYTVTKLRDVHDMSNYPAILAVDCTATSSLVFTFDNATTAAVLYY